MGFLTLFSFVFFTGLVGLITWMVTRHDHYDTSERYFLAGRTLTGGYIAGSLLLTNLSTEQMVGLNGAAFKDGLSVMAWEVVAAFSLVVMGLFFLPRYLRSGITTVPQFFEERFDSGTRAITTFLFISAYMIVCLPIILYTGATGLAGILDLKALTGIQSDTAILWCMVWLIGIIGSIYAIFGGLRAVAVSDTINGFGLLTGGVLITVLGLWAVNGEGILPALQTLREAHPEKYNSVGGPEQSVPFFTLSTGVLIINLFYWTTNQQIIQRTLGASSLAEGQRGVFIAGFFKVLAPIILVLPGLIAFHLYNAEGLAPDHAYGRLVQAVLPAPLAGFFAAVMVGAILSSFNSVLNSTATLYSLGIYQPMMHPEATEAELIRSGKRFGWVIAILSMMVAPLLAGQESIFAYLQKMNGIYFIPLFAVVLVGLLTKRVPAVAAKTGLLLGLTVILCGYFVPYCAAVVSQIGGFHFLALVFLGLIAVMLGIGAIYPRQEAWVHKDAGEVDLTPWKYAWPAGIGLTLTVVSIYIYFGDLSVLSK
ncbi:MAG: solute:sodium symporter family transporter [Candidatus Hydrogenedentes bacterium]|nr:solute:sodium symporter family transporter [Candidatus Hydrogenedentota bacterium]